MPPAITAQRPMKLAHFNGHSSRLNRPAAGEAVTSRFVVARYVSRYVTSRAPGTQRRCPQGRLSSSITK
jgi:hypothetical protein